MATYFISHASADRNFVEDQLLGLLNALGIKFWYSKEDIKTGDYWEGSIKNALESSDGLLLVMSPESAKSEWVKYELNWAMENRPGRVIPVLYKECKSEDFHIRLQRIQFADFYTNEGIGRNQLTHVLINVEHDANSRIKAITGAWKGTVDQEKYMDEQWVNYPIEILIKVTSRRDFSGSMSVASPEGNNVDFTLTGGFLFERFVQFSYYAIDPGRIQFGTIILELDATGKIMSGKWVGYGANTKNIINGQLTINKKTKSAILQN